LADKGYFRGPVDGNWGAESSEALKSFQRDQNLDGDGKIGALSLMALGLGPKRGTASAQNVSTPGSQAAGEPPGAGEPVDPPPVALPQP
jgi:peptidoglycan hydrolase-like protein with peptidoglycan-binding domain